MLKARLSHFFHKDYLRHQVETELENARSRIQAITDKRNDIREFFALASI